MDAKSLSEKVVLLSRELRRSGAATTTRHSQTAIRALGKIDLYDDTQIYHALRCTLVSRKEDYDIFQEVFNRCWPCVGSSDPEEKRLGGEKPQPEIAPSGSLVDAGWKENPEADPLETEFSGTYSRTEILREKDFGELSDKEEKAVRELLKQIEWKPRKWRSRRMKAGGKIVTPDLRRTIRKSWRHGGEVIRLLGREKKLVIPTMVVLTDVSGSMEKYSKTLLYLLHRLHQRGSMRLESFLFGTRLTRATRHFQVKNSGEAMRKILLEARDWSGGTRIGEALRQFNYDWARRVLRGKAIVLVVSDGLDRGDLSLLIAELRRLQANCHRLLWLNPLLGGEDYEPLATGMLAALPYIDDFLPIHNLTSLEELGFALEHIPRSRAVRQQQPQHILGASQV